MIRLRYLITASLLVGLSISLSSAHAELKTQLPPGLSFIGLTNDGWLPFIVTGKGQLQAIESIVNPRQFTWSAHTEQAVYSNPAGALQLYHRSKISALFGSADTDSAAAGPTHAYTQFTFYDQGKQLWAIRLINQKSEKTEIVRFNFQTQHFETWHQHAGAVFDVKPSPQGVYYSLVNCVVQCGGIRQELWMRMHSGEAFQLTRFNSMVCYPEPWAEQKVLFSVYQEDGYQIWQLDSSRPTMEPKQLTQLISRNERYSDLWPSANASDSFYFVRRSAQGGRLLHWRAGTISNIPTPGILDIRDLEITQ